MRLSPVMSSLNSDLVRAEPQREQHLAPERFERHAAAAGVLREHVVVAARVVELARRASGRSRSRWTARRNRCSAPAIGRSGIVSGGRSRTNRTGRPSLVTWLTGPSVRPYPCVNVSRSLTQVRLGRLLEFSSRADSITCRGWPLMRVAIVVHRHEVVVRADLLDLAERIEQRLVIPEPDVLERGRVARDVVARERARRRTAARSSTRSSAKARRVASMLCWMNGDSRACSLGVTTKRCSMRAVAPRRRC